MAGQSPPIYLDYNGTTPIAKEVCEAMSTMMYTHWGNPSSSHYYGVQAKRALETARRQVAALIGAEAGEIIFMSNGTETINHTLKGLYELEGTSRDHIITQASEHVAVLETCKALERHGCKVTLLPVDGQGFVSPDAVEAAITPRTLCISIMHSNNETGTLQPIAEIVKRARKQSNHIYVHCDASQSMGKLPVNVGDLGVDMLTMAGHKLYAPKGIGALYVRQTVPELPQYLSGGGQEGGRRASTENVVHSVALGKACEIALRDLAKSQTHMQNMRDRLEQQIRDNLGEQGEFMRLNGPRDSRLPNTLNVSFHRVEANTLLSEIQDEVAASAGAACHSDSVEVSHVLEAMGVPVDWAMGTCRFTVGRETTEAEIDKAAKIISAAVSRLLPSTGATDNQAPPEMAEGTVKLTRFTHGMGCACKLRPQLLEQVLAKVRAAGGSLIDPNVIAGLGASNEDACVYKLSDDLAVVGTLDFFTPIVDDPASFGAVAAANALSDVYAMGAKPIFALNIVGFPSNRLSPDVLAQILRGGQDKCMEAGVPILGGHTVEDLEPKYGLAVIGVVHPDKFWRNNTVRAGDKLVLTKPIGTGVLSTAMKRGALAPASCDALVANFVGLNKIGAECAEKSGGVHAATDVTGFGLLGHLCEMMTPANATEAAFSAVLRATAVPLLPEARELALDDQCVPGGTLDNLKMADAAGVSFAADVPRELRVMMADAQTSGGLLLSIDPGVADALIVSLHSAGLTTSAIIGEVRSRENSTSPVVLLSGRIQVKPTLR
eukprot:CAMPEP_0194538892 /NCGR_PEP_ID=MMETSP0253-20130528/78638_1 /TAXON_ID=2966 /ORGANISM="Noctiluca scintillans" /LENGTH=775 /DNA_ID=CAMNT_0039385085 /DNA_START=45 /DNA_END=2369 /DNA_ORIENTATION=+